MRTHADQAAHSVKDILQSKNAVPALVVFAVGVVFAVFAPLFMSLPSWIAGVIGLITGTVAVLMAVRGSGASDEELLLLRTAAKAVQRGQAPSRPMYASHAISDLLEIFESIASDIEQKSHRTSELDQAQSKLQADHARLQADLEQRQQRLAELEQSVSRAQHDVELRSQRSMELEQSLMRAQHEVEQRAQKESDAGSRFESPFSEITDEDIDRLFGD